MLRGATDQKLGTLLRIHEAAFYYREVCRTRPLRPQEDRLERRVPRLRPLLGFSIRGYAGNTGAQTKGKVESGVKYVCQLRLRAAGARQAAWLIATCS